MRLEITMIYSSCEKEAKKSRQFQTGSYALRWKRVANARPTDRTSIGVHCGNIARPKLTNRILAWTCSTLNITVSKQTLHTRMSPFQSDRIGFQWLFPLLPFELVLYCRHKTDASMPLFRSHNSSKCTHNLWFSFWNIFYEDDNFVDLAITHFESKKKLVVKCDKNSIKQ